jgi:hypothetical protein
VRDEPAENCRLHHPLLPVFPNVWAWFPIRFALGLGTELVFIAGDI